ncbi:SDR family NAD(P)-dependent oxidoreductase [Chloroflexota bacterium]
MSRVLEDQVAIITGAGRGIGRAIALRFAEEGAKLLLPDISLERAQVVVKEIRDKGGTAEAMEIDISNEKATLKMAEKVIQHYDKVDILLNNAALYYGIDRKPWDSWTVGEWERLFSVNVTGTWLCCKAIVPLMISEGKGKIINIASDIVKNPSAHLLLPYACSKSAVYTLTQSLARALGPSGINVNTIGPGFTGSEASLNRIGSSEAFEAAVEAQCLKRREEPTDLVGTAVFLASKDSDFITGQSILVNGGIAMI